MAIIAIQDNFDCSILVAQNVGNLAAGTGYQVLLANPFNETDVRGLYALFFRLFCSLFSLRLTCLLPSRRTRPLSRSFCAVRTVRRERSVIHAPCFSCASLPHFRHSISDAYTNRSTDYSSRSSLPPSSSRSNPLARPTQRRSLHQRSAPRVARAAPHQRPPPPRQRRAGSPCVYGTRAAA